MKEEQKSNFKGLNHEFYKMLSVSSYNYLRRFGITAEKLTNMRTEDLMKMKSLAVNDFYEILDCLHSLGLYLRDEKEGNDEMDRGMSLGTLVNKVESGHFPKRVIFGGKVFTWEECDYICRDDGFEKLLASLAFKTSFVDAVKNEIITEIPNDITEGLLPEEVEYVKVLAKVAGTDVSHIKALYKDNDNGKIKLFMVPDKGHEYEFDVGDSVFASVPVRKLVYDEY